MRIYFSHSRGEFDYKNGLYFPLRSSQLNNQHEILFPHETSDGPFNSRELMDSIGLFGAEVSYPSTGLGIELGTAFEKKVPIACFYLEGKVPARSVHRVTKHVFSYTDSNDLVRLLAVHLASFA